jgi:hypothetical protein
LCNRYNLCDCYSQRIKASISVFTDTIYLSGNACEEEIPDLIEYNLVPTVGSIEFLREWALYSECPEYIFQEQHQVINLFVLKKIIMDNYVAIGQSRAEILATVIPLCLLLLRSNLKIKFTFLPIVSELTTNITSIFFNFRRVISAQLY